jgi:hypothetical protein
MLSFFPLPYNTTHLSWLVTSYNGSFFTVSMWSYHWRFKYPFAFVHLWEWTYSSPRYCCNPSLGFATKARGCKVAGQVGDPGALHMLSGVQRVWGNEPSHSQVNSHVRSWSPERTPESSEHDCRGQISLPWGVLYIIGKLLKRRCLKWACMAHLDIWNTSYGQKKGRESNWQFDSRPIKVGNRPNLLGCRQRATYCWKALDKSYNFASDRTSIRGLLVKLWGSKVPGVLVGGISGFPRGSPEKEKPFGCRPRGESQSIL